MIPNLQTEDTGVYTCKAKNVYGEVNATFPVKVYGKFTKRVACNLPGMPNILWLALYMILAEKSPDEKLFRMEKSKK